MSATAIHSAANLKARDPERCYFVRALHDIEHPKAKRKIIEGQFVCIDPDATPEDGNWILCGKTLQPWEGQHGISGVATAVYTDESHDW